MRRSNEGNNHLANVRKEEEKQRKKDAEINVSILNWFKYLSIMFTVYIFG